MARVSVTVLPETATAVGACCAVPSTETEKALAAGTESSSSARSNVTVSVAPFTAEPENAGGGGVLLVTAWPVKLAASPPAPAVSRSGFAEGFV